MAESATAVVIGLDSVTGLQTARVLHAQGIPLLGLATDVQHYCARTNVCTKVIGVDTHSEACIGVLEALSAQFDHKPVLYPCADEIVLLLARHSERLRPGYHLLLPDLEVLERLMDKAMFAELAAANDLPIPPTKVVRDNAEAVGAAEDLRFPCIAKPPLRNDAWARDLGFKVMRLESAEEWLALYERCRAYCPTVVLQEWIEGDDSCLFTAYGYFDAEGRVLATFSGRKLRQWPPERGVGSLAQETRNETVLAMMAACMGALRFHGLCHVEMKRDAVSGKYFLIEANVGRPAQRTGLPERAGVPLIYTSYCDAIGIPPPAHSAQEDIGIKWIRIRCDLQSALYYWRNNQLSINDWWRSIRGPKVYAVFSWRDPLPFWLDLYCCFAKMVTRLKGGMIEMFKGSNGIGRDGRRA